MKKLLLGIMCGFSLVSLTACNKQLLDVTYTFDEAIIELQDGTVVQGKIQSWTDYTDGDQVQVKMEDGRTYLVHSSKITLIAE